MSTIHHPLLDAALHALPMAQRPSGPFHAEAPAPVVEEFGLVRVARWCAHLLKDRARRGELARIARIESAIDPYLAVPRRLGKASPELRELEALGEPKTGCSVSEAAHRDAARAAAWYARGKLAVVLPTVRQAVQRVARELAVRPVPMTGAGFVDALDQRLMQAEMSSLLTEHRSSGAELGEVLLRHGDGTTLDLVVASLSTGDHAVVARTGPETWVSTRGSLADVLATVPDTLFEWASRRLRDLDTTTRV